MNNQRKKSQGSETSCSYGGWDFARDFFSGIFGLLNSGRIYPACILMVFIIMGIVVWRLPNSELALLVREFFGVLRSSYGFAMSLLVATNLMWAWLLKRQQRIYENEIERLVRIRRELMHQDGRVPIKKHRSSEEEQIEGYILPNAIKTEEMDR